ncbi:hypothetical protein ZIOFF_025112 [Zingiber officinale]|uniref:Fucosyltransferase n=1 Tax=Zingiber officinale TaxID=94328 RepID=A0A8J5LGS0_ZINOF|nr:hypothetical protein ZIOFF_025112 [Zingiber officinale]
MATGAWIWILMGSVNESLGGLLSLAFDESSCRSRFESAKLLKPPNHTPSPYLLEKLRSYEALHQKCGPNTELYRESIRQLTSNRSGGGPTECNYVVWLPQHALGNRMISITSAFLYALLNDKVLLLFFPDCMNGLFCEPFPNTTWLLPSNFPITHVTSIFDKDPNRYGNLLRDKILRNDMNITNASIPLPAYLYLHLVHNNNDYDRMFYCEDAQLLLRQFPCLDTKDAAALSDIIRVKPKAVLVTSLKSEYFERIRDTYYRNATATGEVIGVYQPSHEEKQFTEKLDHNVKALAEIYLLSLRDSLITSQYSTFGYVAQGLGGIRPWLLVRLDDENLCLQSSTMEPCFHFPPSFECKSRRELDLGSVVPYVRHCEDKAGGIKLFY